MKIGLIDVDGHNYPNLALMKLSAWHKMIMDDVSWYGGLLQYDIVYMAKVFDETYSQDVDEPMNAGKVIKGGTGYIRRDKEGLKFYRDGYWTSKAEFFCSELCYQEFLPDEIEHMYPDYSLYGITDTAYGFLTRGCPRNCSFCIVSDKEGRKSCQVANLTEWWHGQKNIVLMDPNLLACPNHMDLLRQLIESNSYVDFNQGLDCRFLSEENIDFINRIRIKKIHFAWDFMKETDRVLAGLNLYRKYAVRKPHGSYGTVYILTNYNTTMEENLYRIETVRSLGFDPYVMIYDKPNASREIRNLQRWCNNRKIWKECLEFKNYRP